MLLETRNVRVVGSQAAAGANHFLAPAGHLGDQLPFHLAESFLPLVGENLRDAPARALFDNLVGIDQFETQRRRAKPSDRRLARSHKADEGQVVDLAGGGHGASVLRTAAERRLNSVS